MAGDADNINKQARKMRTNWVNSPLERANWVNDVKNKQAANGLLPSAPGPLHPSNVRPRRLYQQCAEKLTRTPRFGKAQARWDASPRQQAGRVANQNTIWANISLPNSVGIAQNTPTALKTYLQPLGSDNCGAAAPASVYISMSTSIMYRLACIASLCLASIMSRASQVAEVSAPCALTAAPWG